ncbi:5-(carboxyamino)imidazole ribonucleotide mutase [Candidatus Roizmanbacteria bacterium RIFCSPHIGHO2_12_FULL_41_11]|uniref:N5-carboxyaminoimidazole ribonucleotide mutase n=1 Tax=Candidatus Roizmanbacteria bacterium RIFCSPHIGHO2_12_FULL_41_11 TaxID=1802052 RepID=A0A1F7I5Y0_9BACT|nr:MAG: 5-(carboxyamino)imidazole ribonucleotide mutase [Candidatus Roizmanbacteria bacterium RIFCSPHIGHO2_12_FULL_41_11]
MTMSKPLVAVIMGSDSDLPVMNDTVEILNKFDIPFEVNIFSAHRSPDGTVNFAKNADKRGIRVIIAAAGGAAHLAGVIASHFPLPVIGVPIKSSALNGVDSLYSIVQMPPGVPVATVGINSAKNAALLAIQILAINDKLLTKKIVDYKKNLAESVAKKNDQLTKVGVKNYLAAMGK